MAKTKTTTTVTKRFLPSGETLGMILIIVIVVILVLVGLASENDTTIHLHSNGE